MVVPNVRSLKSLCMDAVAKHLDVYLMAFEVEENKALKHFLQLTSTNTLLSEVRGGLRKKHASFFINPYLEKLDLNQIPAKDIDAMIIALEKQGEGISEIRLVESDTHYPEATLAKLARSLPKSLKTIHLTAKACSDEIVQVIFERCKNLQNVDLHECAKVTDNGLETVFSENGKETNTTLLKLNVKGTALTTRIIMKLLEYCPHLIELDHPRVSTAIFAIYIRTLSNNLELKQLKLEVLNMQSGEVEACQALCPNVRSISALVRSQAAADLVANFKNLRQLSIFGVGPISLELLFENVGHQLESLETKGEIRVSMDSILEFCPNLKRMRLRLKR